MFLFFSFQQPVRISHFHKACQCCIPAACSQHALFSCFCLRCFVTINCTALCQGLPSQLTPVVLQTCTETYLHTAPLCISGHFFSGLVVQVCIPSWLCDQPATVYAVHAAIWLVIDHMHCSGVCDGQQSLCLLDAWHGNSGGVGCLHPSCQQPGMCANNCSDLAHTTYL